jgi:hypothetical protein
MSFAILAHRFIAYQKFGNKIFDKTLMIRHLNGNSLDNSWDNLELGTNQDNQMDIPKDKRIQRSSKGGKASKKFSFEEIDQIREEHQSGLSYSELMIKWNISSKGTMSHIINHEYLK